MKNQAYRMAMLYDFYGDLLTPRQKEFYDLYYNDDLPWRKSRRTMTSPGKGCGILLFGRRKPWKTSRKKPA